MAPSWLGNARMLFCIMHKQRHMEEKRELHLRDNPAFGYAALVIRVVLATKFKQQNTATGYSEKKKK